MVPSQKVGGAFPKSGRCLPKKWVAPSEKVDGAFPKSGWRVFRVWVVHKVKFSGLKLFKNDHSSMAFDGFWPFLGVPLKLKWATPKTEMGDPQN